MKNYEIQEDDSVIMSGNFESIAIADRYDNLAISDDKYDILQSVDNKIIDRNDMDDIVIEDVSILDSDETEICEVASILENISSSSLLQLQEIGENMAKPKLTTNVIAAIELMAILCSCGASPSLYDKIVTWLEHVFHII